MLMALLRVAVMKSQLSDMKTDLRDLDKKLDRKLDGEMPNGWMLSSPVVLC